MFVDRKLISQDMPKKEKTKVNEKSDSHFKSCNTLQVLPV